MFAAPSKEPGGPLVERRDKGDTHTSLPTYEADSTISVVGRRQENSLDSCNASSLADLKCDHKTDERLPTFYTDTSFDAMVHLKAPPPTSGPVTRLFWRANGDFEHGLSSAAAGVYPIRSLQR